MIQVKELLGPGLGVKMKRWGKLALDGGRKDLGSVDR